MNASQVSGQSKSQHSRFPLTGPAIRPSPDRDAKLNARICSIVGRVTLNAVQLDTSGAFDPFSRVGRRQSPAAYADLAAARMEVIAFKCRRASSLVAGRNSLERTP